MRSSVSKIIAGVAVITGLATLTEAAVVVTQTGQNTAFAVSSSDLLQTSLAGAVNGLTLNVGENNGAGGNTYVILTDGLFGDTDQNPSLCIASGTITYNLNTSGNTFGYNISNINTYSGWANGGRDSQAYTVSYSVVGDAGFTDLATVTIKGLSTSQEKWAITEDATGILATGVDAIRFTFPTQENGGVGYKELDVIGTVFIPPPALDLILYTK